MMKYIIFLLLFITNIIFSQEMIIFDDFNIEDYESGIMYVETKIYRNNTALANKTKKLLNEMPVIKKYQNINSTIYFFTGNIVDTENNVVIIDVKLKLLNDDYILENELLYEFNIKRDEIKTLIENVNEEDDFIINGKDTDGSFELYKNLYVNDSYEIEDNFGMVYAYIVYFNLSNIDQEKISRRLMYYIMEFTY